MQIKETKPMNVLCFTQKTTLSEMMKYVRLVANDLHRSAIENKMEVTGPVYWVYDGADGQPETVFTLSICIPVFHTSVYNGSFELRELPSFSCCFDIHSGSWSEMAGTYEKIIGEIVHSGHSMTGVTREVYINMDFETPENNCTEIQIGIK